MSPRPIAGVAYVDEDIRVAEGRYLMEPMVFARLLSEAHVKPTDLVLDVACGTGYSSAVLGRLAEAVVALEEEDELVAAATAFWLKKPVTMWRWSRVTSRQDWPNRAPMT